MDRFSYGGFAGDASQRVQSIVSAAEAEAAALLRDAEREAEIIRREAQAEGDRIVAERMQLLADMSDAIVERTEMLFDRIDAAGQVKRQFDDLLRGLGEAAESLAREAGIRRSGARSSVHVPRAAAHTQSRPAPAPAPRTTAAPVRPVPPAPEPAPPPRREPPPPIRRPEPLQKRPEPRRVDDKTDARFDGARLVALQMAVAGSTREEVHAELQRAFRLADPAPILDDVFGGPRRSGVAG